MKIKATFFRQNLYKLLDSVLEKGETLELERNGKTIIIMEKKKKDIYTIMDSRTSTLSEPEAKFNTKLISGLENNWEEKWENKWEEWLNEN